MNRFFVFLLTLCMTTGAMAQVVSDSLAVDSLPSDSIFFEPIILPNILDSMPHATIHQDSTITRLMRFKQDGGAVIQRNGYRVQVYASNRQQEAKNEAILLQQRLEKEITEPVYVISEPPFWKVRIGDFITREQAMLYKAELLTTCPYLQASTYVVSDQITIVK